MTHLEISRKKHVLTERAPEFRLDGMTREWVAITGTRQDRPNLPAIDECPFCIGGLEAEHPYVVKAFPNRWPPMRLGDPLDLTDASVGVAQPARGAAEVVLYSPDHDASFATLELKNARAVVDLWAERTTELLARPELDYVLVFENNGAEVGATIGHPHGQIYAFPFVPPVPAKEAAVAASFGCQICAELAHARELEPRIVDVNDSFIAYARYAAGWPFELLITPLGHVADLDELDEGERDDFARVLANALSRYRGLFAEPLPHMFWIHPGVHLHLHLVTTRRQANTIRYVAAGELGSGTLFNPVAPEVAAAMLRGVGG
jgi:UDPglucose--hexose-1-phosphate uridylyltransferase